MKVVIAADSFKGSVSSAELGIHIGNGILKVFPAAEIVSIPVADGGEGTVRALVEGLGGKMIDLPVKNPLMECVNARYGIVNSGKTAVIEMAAASGLPLIEADKRNPLETTTYGTGELIKDALQRGCREFIIGIGGSATNDAGMGMLCALGYRFLDKTGASLHGCGKNLEYVDSIDASGSLVELKDSTFYVACDVDNPLHGPNGAACVYGAQKGASEQEIAELDRGLVSFARVVQQQTGISIDDLPGSGAAGGLGGGFVAFLKATLQSGIDIILDKVGFDELIRGADFVITGEGRIDSQTSMGKAPAGIAKRCYAENIPVIALGGSIEEVTSDIHYCGITSVHSVLNRPLSLTEAMDRECAAAMVEQSAEQLFRLIKVCKS